MAKRLTVEDLAAKRAMATAIAAVESTVESYKVAGRERSGCLIRQNGKIVRKRKRNGVYVSAVQSMMHSTSVKLGNQMPGKAVEIIVRDSIIRTQPELLVKVIKGVPKSTAIQLAMVAGSAAE